MGSALDAAALERERQRHQSVDGYEENDPGHGPAEDLNDRRDQDR